MCVFFVWGSKTTALCIFTGSAFLITIKHMLTNINISMNIDPKSKEHIDRKLILRLRMFVAILFVMTGVLIYDFFTNKIDIFFILVGIVIGVGVGIILARIFYIEWHQKSSKVIGRLDLVGGIVLTLYIILSIFRNWIFAHWFSGPLLSAFTVSFIEGVMIGRIISMRLYIKKILSDHGKK